ncbi:MAG TPA: hypothetical protein VGN88_11060 [Phycisphaerae bacterium]|jgi:hypothetical protein
MSSTPVNSQKHGRRRYLIEFSLAMIIYVAVVWIRGWLLQGPMFDSQVLWAHVMVVLLPIIPVALMTIAVMRCLQSMDELMRRIQTESLAIAGVVTALMAVTYGLLEGPHFPFLSAWRTYEVFGVTWLVTSIFLKWRYR